MGKNEEVKKLLKTLLELDFSEKRIDYYMQELRKIGFYELEEERSEYMGSRQENAE
ncbi:MAG: hypothetical protein ACRC8M_02415 [Cetobacterium sp.]|uniref:hypothetical protein n=1 Tax=Cetobacterium sp. TaxID=2071632 RepID=UPI003F2E203F